MGRTHTPPKHQNEPLFGCTATATGRICASDTDDVVNETHAYTYTGNKNRIDYHYRAATGNKTTPPTTPNIKGRRNGHGTAKKKMNEIKPPTKGDNLKLHKPTRRKFEKAKRRNKIISPFAHRMGDKMEDETLRGGYKEALLSAAGKRNGHRPTLGWRRPRKRLPLAATTTRIAEKQTRQPC